MLRMLIPVGLFRLDLRQAVLRLDLGFQGMRPNLDLGRVRGSCLMAADRNLFVDVSDLSGRADCLDLFRPLSSVNDDGPDAGESCFCKSRQGELK